MNTILTDLLVADLDRMTARLVEIVATNIDHPQARAFSIAQTAIIALWAHTEDTPLREALDRLMTALNKMY